MNKLPSAEEQLAAREQKLRDDAQLLLRTNESTGKYAYGHAENFKELVAAVKRAKLGKVKRVMTRALLLHEGWEMDNYAALVEFDDGRVEVVTTSHGWAYIMSREEAEKTLRKTELSAASIGELLANWPTK